MHIQVGRFLVCVLFTCALLGCDKKTSQQGGAQKQEQSSQDDSKDSRSNQGRDNDNTGSNTNTDGGSGSGSGSGSGNSDNTGSGAGSGASRGAGGSSSTPNNNNNGNSGNAGQQGDDQEGRALKPVKFLANGDKQASSTNQHVEINLQTNTLKLRPTFVAGQKATSLVMPAASGGSGSYVYSIQPNLPQGMHFDPGTRELSGRPTEVLPSREYTYEVRDRSARVDDEGAQSKALQLKLSQGRLVARLTFSLEITADLKPVFTSASNCSNDNEHLNPAGVQTLASSLSRKLQKLIVGTPVQNTPLASLNLPTKTLGPVVLPLACSGNGELSYSLSPPLPQGLSFDASTRTLSGTSMQILRRTTYTFKVVDGDSNTADTDASRFTFQLAVAEDTYPSFSTRAERLNLVQALAMPAVELPRAQGGNSQLVYSLTPALPQGLSFDANTRRLAGTPLRTQEAIEYTYKAVDQDGALQQRDSITQTFVIAVEADTAPRFDDVARAKIEMILEHNTLIEPPAFPRATGGNKGLRYSISPLLPEGISFDKRLMRLSGTPRVLQNKTKYIFKVEDGDSNHNASDTDSLEFSIEIKEPDTRPEFSPTARIETFNLEVGTAMQPALLPRAYGGNGDRIYSIIPDLPQGLSFDASTRELSGTPRVAGSGVYTYKVVDSDDNDNNSDADTLSFVINITQPDTSPQFNRALTENEFVTLSQLELNQALTPITLPSATGGEGRLSYSLRPDLPAGLSFDASTRELSGTPTEEMTLTEYTYKVVDGDANEHLNDADIINFIMRVSRPQPPQPSSLQLARTPDLQVVHGARSSTFSLGRASGGTAPYVYRLRPTSGVTRVSGLTFSAHNNTLRYSFNLLSPGSYSFIHSVTDDRGDTVSQSFTFTKLGPLRLPQGNNYLYDKAGGTITLPAATGGLLPYTYKLKQYYFPNDQNEHGRFGNLEAGLGFNPISRSFIMRPYFRGGFFAFSYTVEDASTDWAYTHIYLQPGYVEDPQGYKAYAVRCTDKYGFRSVDLDTGLTFNVVPSARQMLNISQQAAKAWNTILDATAFSVSLSTNIETKWGDNLSTISNGGMQRAGIGWGGFATNTRNPLNWWFSMAVDIVVNPIHYPYYLTRPRRALSLMTHEMGHGLGLGHSPNSNHVMYYSSSGNKIHQDEVRLVRCLYDRPEATPLLLSQFGNDNAESTQMSSLAAVQTPSQNVAVTKGADAQASQAQASSLAAVQSKARLPAQATATQASQAQALRPAWQVRSRRRARPPTRAYTQLKIDGQDYAVLQARAAAQQLKAQDSTATQSDLSQSAWGLHSKSQFSKLSRQGAGRDGSASARGSSNQHSVGGGSTGGWHLNSATGQFECGWRPD